MNVLYVVVGSALVVFSLVDLLWSTIGIGGGPMLRYVGAAGSRVALWIYSRFNLSHTYLAGTGVVLICGMLILWLSLPWLGWSLILHAWPEALITPDALHAEFIERVYFVGATMASLGRGDLALGGSGWKIVTILIALHGVFVVTLLISFLLPVTQAAANSRSFARLLATTGRAPAEVAAAALLDREAEEFRAFMAEVSRELLKLQEQHVTYPLLHFMHAPYPEKALALRLAVLDEALTLIQCGAAEDHGVTDHSFEVVRKLIAEFLGTLDVVHPYTFDEAPPPPDLDALREQGIEVRSDREWRDALEQLTERREGLRSLVYSAGWHWHDVTDEEAEESGEPEVELVPG